MGMTLSRVAGNTAPDYQRQSYTLCPRIHLLLAAMLLGVLLSARGRAADENPIETPKPTEKEDTKAKEEKTKEEDKEPVKEKRVRGVRSSMIPGEEKFEPLEAPISTADAEKLEAKKLLVIGYMQVQQRKLNQALHTLETALKHDPESPAILKELAYLALQLERTDDSLEYCRRALKLLPGEYELWHAYGVKNKELRNFDVAIESLEQASKVPDLAKKDPDVFFEVRLELADLYDLKGNQEGVIAAMQDVLDFVENPHKYNVDPQLARQIERNKLTLYRKLGAALKNAKRSKEAVEVLERGRNSGDSGKGLACDLAEVYYENGDYDKAQVELDDYLRVADERGLVLYEKVLDKLGKKGDLPARLQTMVDRDPENAALRKFYGERLLDAGEFEKARTQLLKVRGRADTLPLLTRLFRQMNQPKELLQAFTESMSSPNGQEALPPQIRALAADKEFLREVAKAAREMKVDEESEVPKFFADLIVAEAASEAQDVELAKEFYERCIKERPDASPLYLKLVELLFTNKHYDEVVTVSQQAIDKKVPGEFEFYDRQARALAMLDKTDQAVEVIEKLIGRLGDGDAVVEANVILAWIYQHAQNWEKAEEVCNRVITEFPGVRRVPYIRYLLSNIYTLGGHQNKAEEQLQLLLELDPQAVSRDLIAAANNDLGYLWADEGKNLEQAEKMVRKALEINPTNAAYLDSLGWVLFKAGKYQEAVDYLQRATKEETGQDAVIWDHLGDAYRKTENFADAKKSWEKAVELYKKDEQAKDQDKVKAIEQKLDFLDNPEPAPPKRAEAGDP